MARLLGTLARCDPVGDLNMAKTKVMNVPAGMIDQFLKTLVPSKNRTQIRLRPGVRVAEQRKEPSYTTRFCAFAASWITLKATANASKSEESELYSKIWADLRNGVFDPVYWQELSPISDVTEYATPKVDPYDRLLNTNYEDAAHKPSICTFKDISKTYNTPMDDGTSDHPAPGWAGTTIDTIWQDIYHAQRKLVYALPRSMTENDFQPIAIHVVMDITANATSRGNRNWFAFAIERYLHQSILPVSGTKGAVTHWNPEDWYKFKLPAEGTGPWDATVRREILDGADSKLHVMSDKDMNRLTLRVATPPSLGMYGSRNDEVRVIHHETIKVYWAK
ncbi:MAG: hypothetical protein RKO66_12015 [Candidatus Contendobacter sp.]|nr:hypothetical protein [Candidatus Contendobacter sp.]